MKKSPLYYCNLVQNDSVRLCCHSFDPVHHASISTHPYIHSHMYSYSSIKSHSLSLVLPHHYIYYALHSLVPITQNLILYSEDYDFFLDQRGGGRSHLQWIVPSPSQNFRDVHVRDNICSDLIIKCVSILDWGIC